jgi:hypothetical protein
MIFVMPCILPYLCPVSNMFGIVTFFSVVSDVSYMTLNRSVNLLSVCCTCLWLHMFWSSASILWLWSCSLLWIVKLCNRGCWIYMSLRLMFLNILASVVMWLLKQVKSAMWFTEVMNFLATCVTIHHHFCCVCRYSLCYFMYVLPTVA